MSEVLRDLVVSLSLDGDNFSRNLTSINKQIQEAESEFRRAASGVDNFEKSVSGTQSQLSSLQQKLALQQKAVQQYEKALAAANKKLETSYTRQGKLTKLLDAARQKNADLKQQVAAATKQYERFSRELGESDSAMLAAKANLDALTQEYADSSAEVKKLEGQLAANTKSLQNNADAVTRARTNLNNAQGSLRQTEQQIAKNYLSEFEMGQLDRMVSAYLDFAESMTLRHIPLTMQDWETRLNGFIQMFEYGLLKDSGKVTAEIAKLHAETEFEKYRVIQDKLFLSDFDKYMLELEETAKEINPGK